MQEAGRMQDPRYQEDFFFQREQTLSEGFQSAFSIFHYHHDMVEATCSCQGNVLRGEWQQGCELGRKTEGMLQSSWW